MYISVFVYLNRVVLVETLREILKSKSIKRLIGNSKTKNTG